MSSSLILIIVKTLLQEYPRIDLFFFLLMGSHVVPFFHHYN